MRVALTNTVMLNGGDAAIVLAILRVLGEAFGGDTQVVLHDAHPAEAARRYSDLAFAPGRERWRGLRRRRYAGKTLRALDHLRITVAAAGAVRGGRGERGGWGGRVLRWTLPPHESRALSEYRGSDLVISTGGTYLVEQYTLRYRLADLQAAVVSGKPLVLFTQSLGPFSLVENIRAVRRVVAGAPLVLLRDELSREHLRRIAADTDRVHVVPDVVFALAEPEALAAVERGDDERRAGRVAVSVREWKHFRSVTAEEGMRRYEDAVAEVVTRLVRERGARVTFLSTCQGIAAYHFDDSAVAVRIADRLPDDVRERVEVDREFHDPRELLELLKGFAFTIATRMHMGILSLCAGTPVLPIAYEFKTRELFGGLGMGAWVRDIEEVETYELAELALKFADQRESLTPGLMNEVRRLRDEVLAVVPVLRSVVRSEKTGRVQS